MAETQREELENGERADPFSDELVEPSNDEIHDEDKGDDREAEAVGAEMIRKNVAVEFSYSHRLKRLSPASVKARLMPRA
jgi:hypothetical protein